MTLCIPYNSPNLWRCFDTVSDGVDEGDSSPVCDHRRGPFSWPRRMLGQDVLAWLLNSSISGSTTLALANCMPSVSGVVFSDAMTWACAFETYIPGRPSSNVTDSLTSPTLRMMAIRPLCCPLMGNPCSSCVSWEVGPRVQIYV